MTHVFKDYFYGHKISDYGLQHGFVDYRTLAQAFDAVLNNDIMSLTDCIIGEWEQESGFNDRSEEIEELESRIEELEELKAEKEEAGEDEEAEKLDDEILDLENEIDTLREEETYTSEVFQWFIVSDNGAEILKEFNEIVYYNETLDMYLWGVTHWGTPWDYVLTDIPCMKIEKEGV